MPDNFDLDAYLARIGYDGPRRADLPTLKRIHALHPDAIPFENFDPLLGRPVKLDLGSLQAKLVSQRRGGYCFELNALLAAALEALGFSVTPLTARVRWMAPVEQPDLARTHMFLRVDLDAVPYLVDVGFGVHLLGTPLRMLPDIEQAAPGATLRLVLLPDGRLALQTRLPAGWSDLYRFTLDRELPADYEMSNWFTATHPNSRFVTNLIMERLTDESRYTLVNTKFVRRPFTGNAEEKMLSSPDELADVLENVFRVAPPAEAAAIWARLPKG